MSAYRSGGEKRPPKVDPPPERPDPRLFFGLLIAVVVVLAFAYFFWRQSSLSRPPETSAVVEPDVATAIVSAETAPPPAPTRTPLSESNSLATAAAISIASSASTHDRTEIAKLAMSMADAITDPKTTCADYDAAYVALRRALDALADAGDLGDVEPDLAAIERARCAPGTDAG